VDDQGDALAHIQRLEQRAEITAVLDEPIGTRPALRQLVGVAHTDQIGSDATAQRFQMRQHVAPQVRRGRIAVQEDDGIPSSRLHVRHLTAEHLASLLFVRKCGRYHDCFSRRIVELTVIAVAR
jgi:hypothetical protein